MSLDFIRRTYNVPAKRGGRVEYTETNGQKFKGTIRSADHRLCIRYDGLRHNVRIHPTDPALKYLTSKGDPA